METYVDIALNLYTLSLQYLKESRGITEGIDEKREVREASRSRLEIMAATAGILATDVLCNKPELGNMYRGLPEVPISRRELDIARDFQVKLSYFHTCILGIETRTKHHFRFVK